MNLISLIPLVGALVLQGSGGGNVQVWKAADIHGKGQELAKKLDANKVASEVIATDGNRTFMVAHREGSGLSEVHDAAGRHHVHRRGHVTMVYGGTVVDGKTDRRRARPAAPGSPAAPK